MFNKSKNDKVQYSANSKNKINDSEKKTYNYSTENQNKKNLF